MTKQKIWLIYGLNEHAEYTDESYIVDICLNQKAAEKSLAKAKKEEPNMDFWISIDEAHD